MVSVGGPDRSTLDFFLFNVGCGDCCWLVWRAFAVDVRRLSSDFLCARVLERRSVARRDAVTSGDGGSPNMKNLIKAAMRRTTDSWPTMRPCVNDRLDGHAAISAVLHVECVEQYQTYAGSALGGQTSWAIIAVCDKQFVSRIKVVMQFAA